MRLRYIQVSALSPEKQVQAKKMLGLHDPPPESDKLWCGHPKSAIVKYDRDGTVVSDVESKVGVIEVCGMCPPTELITRYKVGG